MPDQSAHTQAPEKAYTGNAYGDDPAHHRIDGERFVCSAPADAKCRTFPTCECENWCCCDEPGENHDEDEHCCMTTLKAGQDCWLEPWVHACGLEDSHHDFGDDFEPYDDEGERRPWPNGSVTCDWDDGILWQYAELVTPPGARHGE